jgi:FKBP-type peptidyl-prolyl cis-trans isomerase
VKQVFVVAALALLAVGCGSKSPTDPSQVSIQFSAVDLVVGTGAQAALGNALSVNYALWLYNPAGTDNKGTQVDAGSFAFALGFRQVITGFEQGVLGMRVGGRRRINVPASLGYGSQGSPPEIPPNAALVFEVELLELVQ